MVVTDRRTVMPDELPWEAAICISNGDFSTAENFLLLISNPCKYKLYLTYPVPLNYLNGNIT